MFRSNLGNTWARLDVLSCVLKRCKRNILAKKALYKAFPSIYASP